MLRVLSVLLLAFLFSSPASAQSNPPPSSIVNLRAEQLQQQINQLQADLKTTQNVQADHDNLVMLNKGLPDLEKRVEDIHQYVAYWGWFSGGAFAVITLLFVYVSFRTLALAKIEAKKAIKKLVLNKVAEITHTIDEKGQEIFNAIAEQADQHHQQLSVLESDHRALMDRLNPSQNDQEKTLDPKDVAELSRITEQLRLKPKDYQYTFDDWRALYLEASNRNALDEVNKSVEDMERSAADDWQNATAKLGRAWLLCQHQQYTEAVKLYDQIIDQCGESEDLRLIERVAMARLNKGYMLSKQDQSQWEAAIAVFDDIVLRYGDRSEEGIAKMVATALRNKSVVLKAQGQWDAMIAACDELVSRYGKRSEAGITEQVAAALFNRAVALDKLKRTFEAKMAYATLIERYGSSTESGILARVKDAKKTINILGNV